MTLEMSEGDKYVGVHDGMTDLRFFDIFLVNRDDGFVRALETVGNQYMTSGLQGRKSVDISGIQVVKCIFAAADIECIAVGEKRLAAALLDIVSYDFRVVRTQE